jgi:hypothetical protein
VGYIIATEYYQQVIAGIGRSVLVLEDTHEITYTTAPWFDTWRLFLNQLNAHIQLTDTWIPLIRE